MPHNRHYGLCYPASDTEPLLLILLLHSDMEGRIGTAHALPLAELISRLSLLIAVCGTEDNVILGRWAA